MRMTGEYSAGQTLIISNKAMQSQQNYIELFFCAWLAFVGITPFILFERYQRRDLLQLIKNGVATEAKILGYERRGAGKSVHTVVVFEFAPDESQPPVTHSKIIWMTAKDRPAPGSIVPMHRNEKFSTITAIDAFGTKQSLESYPDSLGNT